MTRARYSQTLSQTSGHSKKGTVVHVLPILRGFLRFRPGDPSSAFPCGVINHSLQIARHSPSRTFKTGLPIWSADYSSFIFLICVSIRM